MVCNVLYRFHSNANLRIPSLETGYTCAWCTIFLTLLWTKVSAKWININESLGAVILKGVQYTHTNTHTAHSMGLGCHHGSLGFNKQSGINPGEVTQAWHAHGEGLTSRWHEVHPSSWSTYLITALARKDCPPHPNPRRITQPYVFTRSPHVRLVLSPGRIDMYQSNQTTT